MTPQPGDILATRNEHSLAGRLIRLGEAMLDRPNTDNHIAVFTHTDAAGTPWCLEGRPGGLGWRDARHYLADPWTVTNAAQPKSDEQRNLVVAAMHSLIATPYDWAGIAEDTARALHLDDLALTVDHIWHDNGWATGGVPGLGAVRPPPDVVPRTTPRTPNLPTLDVPASVPPPAAPPAAEARRRPHGPGPVVRLARRRVHRAADPAARGRPALMSPTAPAPSARRSRPALPTPGGRGGFLCSTGARRAWPGSRLGRFLLYNLDSQ